MKTPCFWQKNSVFSTLLTPLGWVYGAATQLRLRLGKPHKCKAKVICIGNITAGGVGKTPVAMAMAERYIKAGKKVFFVTRGYKGKLKNIVVDLERHTAAETGDEARLLAGVAPTIIAPRREFGAEKAVRLGAEIIIMDDGFQTGLYKDESWLVFDGARGYRQRQNHSGGAVARDAEKWRKTRRLYSDYGRGQDRAGRAVYAAGVCGPAETAAV